MIWVVFLQNEFWTPFTYVFLAQGVENWRLKEGNPKSGGCDIFVFSTFIAYLQYILTSI